MVETGRADILMRDVLRAISVGRRVTPRARINTISEFVSGTGRAGRLCRGDVRAVSFLQVLVSAGIGSLLALSPFIATVQTGVFQGIWSNAPTAQAINQNGVRIDE